MQIKVDFVILILNQIYPIHCGRPYIWPSAFGRWRQINKFCSQRVKA